MALFLVFRKLVAQDHSRPVTAEWVLGFSSDAYRPLGRLLNEEDFQFLLSQPGISRKTVNRLRAERRRIFRRYLSNLRQDFNRVCEAIHILMLHSHEDRRDLASVLLRQKAVFGLAFAAVQFRLALHAWGLAAVDVRELVAALETMRLQMRQLVPAVQTGVA
jgi:hypothetical protein